MPGRAVVPRDNVIRVPPVPALPRGTDDGGSGGGDGGRGGDVGGSDDDNGRGSDDGQGSEKEGKRGG